MGGKSRHAAARRRPRPEGHLTRRGAGLIGTDRAVTSSRAAVAGEPGNVHWSHVKTWLTCTKGRGCCQDSTVLKRVALLYDGRSWNPQTHLIGHRLCYYTLGFVTCEQIQAAKFTQHEKREDLTPILRGVSNGKTLNGSFLQGNIV